MSQQETARTNETVGGRFRKNLLGKTTILLFQGIATLWLTRYLLGNLGAAVYGLIALAIAVQRYGMIFSHSLTKPIARFLAIDFTTGGTDSASGTFNAGLRSTIILAATLAVPAALLSALAPVIFDIPQGMSSQTRFMFAAAMASLIMITASAPFAVITYARNRLDLHALQSGAMTLVTVILTYLLITAGFGLTGAAVAVAAGGAAFALTSIIQWRWLAPVLHINLSAADKTKGREMIALGWHVFATNSGALLFYNIDIVIAYLLLGSGAAGAFAAAIQIPMLLHAFISELAVIISPTIVALHAEGKPGRIVEILSRAVKWLGLLLAVPIGLMCAAAKPLLGAWLGSEFTPVSMVFTVCLAHLVINFAVIPLFSVPLALNKMKVFGWVTLFAGVINAGLVAAMASPLTGLGIMGIAIAGAIVLSLKNSFFTPFYCAKILGISPRQFFVPLLWPVVTLAISWLLGISLAAIIGSATIPACIAALLVAGFVACIFVWFVALSNSERKWILSLARGL